MKELRARDAPTPRGHYAQALVVNGFIFVAGQLPRSPVDANDIPKGMSAQVARIFENISAILKTRARTLNALVNVQVFLTDMALWKEFDTAYRQALGPHRPPRTVVPCPALNDGALLEITVIASDTELS